MNVGSLEIKLFADIARLQADMNKANQTVDKAMGGIEKSVNLAKRAFLGLGASFSIAAIGSTIDAYKRFDSQLKLATKSTQEYAEAYSNVVRIAKTSQSDIGAIGVLYARLTNSLRDFGTTQKEISTITEAVSLSLRVSNATVEETNSVMLQLSQSFGSGKINGQEFLAVSEGAPIIMRQLAKSLNKTYGELKNLSTEGKLTSEVLKTALSDPTYLAGLREQAKAVGTISSAFTVAKNAFTQYIGEADKGAGTSKLFSAAIIALSENIGKLITLGLVVLVAKFGQWTQAVMTSINASKAAAAQSVKNATLEIEMANLTANAKSIEAQKSIANDKLKAFSKVALLEASRREALLSAAFAFNTEKEAATLKVLEAQTYKLIQAKGALAKVNGLVGVSMANNASATTFLVNQQQEAEAINNKLNKSMSLGDIASRGLARGLGFLKMGMAALGGPVGIALTAFVLFYDSVKGWVEKTRGLTEAVKELNAEIAINKGLRDVGISADDPNAMDKKSIADLDAKIKEAKDRARRLSELTQAFNTGKGINITDQNRVDTGSAFYASAATVGKNAEAALIAQLGIIDQYEATIKSKKELLGKKVETGYTQEELDNFAKVSEKYKTAQELARAYNKDLRELMIASKALGDTEDETLSKIALLKEQYSKKDDGAKQKAQEFGERLQKAEVDRLKAFADLKANEQKRGNEFALQENKRLHDNMLISDQEFYSKEYSLKLASLGAELVAAEDITKALQDKAGAAGLDNVERKIANTEMIKSFNAINNIRAAIKELVAAKADAYTKSIADATRDYTAANEQGADSLRKAIEAQEKHNSEMGLTSAQIELLSKERYSDVAATYDQAAASAANGAELFKENAEMVKLFKNLEAEHKLKADLARRAASAENRGAELDKIEEIRKKALEMSKDINKSLTDALLRGFESGKGFAKNFRDTLINMFKTLVLSPAISFILKPVTDRLAGIFSQVKTNDDGSPKGLLSNVFDTFKNVKSSIFEGVSSLGQSLSNFGNTGSSLIKNIASKIGSFTQINASAISSALGYVGLAITAFSVIKSLFGKKKVPRFSTLRAGDYADGVFTGRSNGQQYKALGAEKQLDGLSEQFSKTLGGFLKGFGLSDSISTTASLFKKRKASYGNFSATFAGGSVSAGEQGKAKNVQQTFEKLVETVLGTTIVQAIQKSKAAEGIKQLFNGLTDKTQVVNMINASLTLQEAQKELADKYGLTVDLAGRVSVASGEAGDALAGFVNSLSAVALSGRTVGAQLIKNKDKLFTDFNTVFGDVLTEAVLSTVSRQVPIAASARTGANIGFGGFGRLPQANGLAGILGQLKAPALQQFTTVTEQVTTFVDRIVSRNLQLPRTIADYDNLLKNIDKSAAAGQKMFAEVFALRDEFVAFTSAVDGLKGNVRGALFGLVSDVEKQGMLNEDLAKLFGSLNLAVPKSQQELIALGRSIDYGTQAGLDLAAVFPSLVSAFKEAQNGIESLAKSLRDESGFKTLYDFNFYKGIASNYGAEFANRLNDGAAVTYGASNNTSANLPLNIAPNNNTTISTSDPNMLNAITVLTDTVNTLKAEIISIKTNTKSSADTLIRVSPDGNSIQTKVAA